MTYNAHFALPTGVRSGVAPLAFAILFFLGAAPANARDAGEAEARVAQCIREAAGGRPWLERTLWGLRDQEGGWIGAEVRNTNGSHDLGPLQINSWWVPKIATLVGRPALDVRAWLKSDPCFNAGAARWIFLSALRTTGDFWRAVGVYHSPTTWRQRRYASSVARHLQRRFGRDVFSMGAESHALVSLVVHDPDEAMRAEAGVIRLHGFGLLNETGN